MGDPASQTGRPTKYSKDLYPKIEKLVKLGATDKFIAEMIGVCEATFTNWKTDYPEFLVFLKESKELNHSDIEQSLHKRATGCTTTERQVIKRLNKDTDEMEIVEEREILKEHAPDTKAMERWLFNRSPDRWKDKKEVDNKLSGEIGVRIIDDIK